MLKRLEWGGRVLRLETGRMARQADGAVLAPMARRTVLATVVGDEDAEAGRSISFR